MVKPMTQSPTDVIADFLQNTAPDKVKAAVRRLVAKDATYISLNFENPTSCIHLPAARSTKSAWRSVGSDGQPAAMLEL
jgi:hypothetical protein